MKKIALIEDEEILRKLMAEELEASGYTVLLAANGKEGWELIQREKPDLVLLDLLMPVMSGYEVLSAVRASAEFKDIPCIVISNSGQTDDLSRAYTSGANDVLIKANFEPKQVREKVTALLQEQSANHS